MAGMTGLSINPSRVEEKKFSEELFLTLFHQQEWGQGYSGFSVLNGTEILTIRERGRIYDNLYPKLVEKGIKGTEGIGCCSAYSQPLQVSSKLGKIAGCLSGNIINSKEIKDFYEGKAHIFSEEQDVEILLHILVQGRDIALDGVQRAIKMIRGAYSFLVLTPKGIYAFCSPDGHWPLILGQGEGMVAVVTESTAFANTDIEIVRELKPGELILLKNGEYNSILQFPARKPQLCSLYLISPTYPTAALSRVLASKIRRKLIAVLARQDIKEGFISDIVAPIPDSAREQAAGYQEEFYRERSLVPIGKELPFRDVLTKFTPARTIDGNSELEEKLKLLPIPEDFSDTQAVICYAYLRKNTIPILKRMEFKELHLRISFPRLLSPCPWGEITREGEILPTHLRSEKEIAEYLGVTSIKFNTIETLLKVESCIFAPERICRDCALREEEWEEL